MPVRVMDELEKIHRRFLRKGNDERNWIHYMNCDVTQKGGLGFVHIGHEKQGIAQINGFGNEPNSL